LKLAYEYSEMCDMGEFLISLKDFIELFDELFIVHEDLNMLNSNLKEYTQNYEWNSIIFEGHWIKGVNSAGLKFSIENYYFFFLRLLL